MNFNEQFAEDIRKGLTSTPKRISSKYFYDEKGSQLFQKIMALDEYYLTRAERQIFQQKSQLLVNALTSRMPKDFQIIELGAGDATKTEILLQELDEKNIRCKYRPTDIDESVLLQVENRLRGKFKNVSIEKIHGYNETILEQLRKDNTPSIILLLGSNIGNYPAEKSVEMLRQIGSALCEGDLFLLGLDKKKDPRRIIKAYDDAEGVTEQFNLNLLRRINRELDADFPVEDFMFYPTYHVDNGEVRSYLIAKKEMQVNLQAIDLTLDFTAWEYIHTEISRKYDRKDLDEFTEQAGIRLQELWSDTNDYFWLALFEK